MESEMVELHRDEKRLVELGKKKLESREKLRALRVEIAKIDSDLLKSGATLADLGAVCW